MTKISSTNKDVSKSITQIPNIYFLEQSCGFLKIIFTEHLNENYSKTGQKEIPKIKLWRVLYYIFEINTKFGPQSVKYKMNFEQKF